MLLELAIGDAYGAGFEYADYDYVTDYNDLSGYARHPTHNIKPGCYTDDTQMSLAIAEVLAEGLPWTREVLADRFVRVFKRDPREGYAGRFYDFLRGVRNGRQFLAEIRPDSDKSGAAMRAAPLGLVADIEQVKAMTALQAAITHDTPDGINAAIAAALTTHYCAYQLGPRQKVGAFVTKYVPGRWADPWRGKVGSKGWMSVRAAITALAHNDTMSGLLQTCVDFGGDVDTVATIALAAGSICNEVEQDLPQVLIDRLENRTYGRDYLQQLDRKLMSAVGLAKPQLPSTL